MSENRYFVYMEEVLSTEELKTRLHQVIDVLTDEKKLQAIYTLLKDDLDPVLKDKLTSRAMRSNQDIKEGKVHDRNEAEQKLRSRLGI